MVGSHLVDFLLENTDWTIHGLCRWNDDFSNLNHIIPRINTGDRISLVYGDLNDYPSLQRAVDISKPDYVFHLAADFERSTETYNFWDSNFKNNVLASHNLMQQVTKYDSLKKIIF